MEKNRNSFLKDVPCWLWIVIGALCIIILSSIIMAIFRGCAPQKTQLTQPEIHVFINDEDSTIIRLQQDVNELKQYIRNLEDDSIEVVVRRVKNKYN